MCYWNSMETHVSRRAELSAIMDRRSLSQGRYVREYRKGGEKNAGGEGGTGREGCSLVCAILIEFFFDVRRNSFVRRRAPGRVALCISVDFFKPAPRIAQLLRRCVNRITASIQRTIAWCSDSRATVSAECNSPKTMHRVKMARIDNLDALVEHTVHT